MKTYILWLQVEVPITAASEAAARNVAKILTLENVCQLPGAQLLPWRDAELVDVQERQS